MTKGKATAIAGDENTPAATEERRHSEILLQLDRIVASPFFKNSKRYPAFLRYVVEHTLAGDTEVLKERTLGTEVFARPSEYDTNADPIVRVTAGEIRKRIAQYYQSPGHEHELRIDLPLGSYVPHFLVGAAAEPERALRSGSDAPSLHASTQELDVYNGEHPAAVPNQTGTPVEAQVLKAGGWKGRRTIFFALTILLICAVATFTVQGIQNRRRVRGIRYFWQPTLSSPDPILIVIGVHSFDRKGVSIPTTGTDADSAPRPNENLLSTLEDTDMVPVSDIVSYSRLVYLLTRNSHKYQTVGSSNATLDDLLRGPVVLVGGLDNIWTLRLSSSLRYRFFSAGDWVYGIRDSQHPSTTWLVNYMQPVRNNSRDYAIVASYSDPTIEQRVLIIAGVGKNGTVAAADFLTTEQHMSDWLSQAAANGKKNVELVLSTEILDGQPGPPHVLASYSW